MIRVSFFRCNNNEKRDIEKIIEAFHDIELSFTDSLNVSFDVMVIPVRVLTEITNEQLEDICQPIICFGEISTIHIALAYSVDDFVIHPFIGGELSARIYKSVPLRFFYSKGLYFSISPDKIICADQSISIRYQEFLILKTLISISPEPVERSLLEQLQQGRGIPGGRSLDMLISKLRRKISEITDCEHEMIIAERGHGYRIIPCWKPLYKKSELR